MADPAAASAALGLVGGAVGIWGLYTRPVHEVRSADTDDTLTRDVRHGEIVAGTLTVIGGFMASKALSSPWPAVVALGLTAVMCWQLEQGLATPGG
jgi:hypothetical protein